MDFTIENIQEGVNGLMRRLGYTPAYFQSEGEYSMVRKLTGGDYPRFHLYIKELENGMHFSLHLDQKKASYEGSHAHNGEYDGDLVEGEVGRIQELLRL